MRENGANDVYAFVTHNLLDRRSFQAIELLPINELVTTNTIINVFIFIIKNYSSGKITTLTAAKLISKYIEELAIKMDTFEY